MTVGGIKKEKNTTKKTYLSFGKTNYPKNLLMKNGHKNTKGQ
jgi:hypothetical protein